MTQTIPKIALTGRMRSGKSEVERYLSFEYGFTTGAFGSMLKYFADKIFTHTPEFQQSSPLEKRKPRKLYQAFGQACREQVDTDVWLRHLAFSYEMAMRDRNTVGFVVSDLRQPNEYEWLRANGFTVIRVSAPADVRKARAEKAGDIFTEDDFEHETESHADSFAVDYEIHNDGGLAELYARVDEIMAELGVGKVNR